MTRNVSDVRNAGSSAPVGTPGSNDVFTVASTSPGGPGFQNPFTAEVREGLKGFDARDISTIIKETGVGVGSLLGGIAELRKKPSKIKIEGFAEKLGISQVKGEADGTTTSSSGGFSIGGFGLSSSTIVLIGGALLLVFAIGKKF